ncbi:MAG: DUF4367 domain-containing protein [Caldilineales bacterium]|nr:DUF4367 domain-containing protein [Caldilineales bacterium]
MENILFHTGKAVIAISRLAVGVTAIIFLASCGSQNDSSFVDAFQPPATIETVVQPTQTHRTIELESWQPTGQDQVNNVSISLAWHSIAMGEGYTDIVYSLTSTSPDHQYDSLRPQSVTLRMNQDIDPVAGKIIPLSDWHGASIGVLRFPGRLANSEFLQVEMNGVEVDEKGLPGLWPLRPFKNINPGADELRSVVFFPRAGYLIAGPTAISFNGSGVYLGNMIDDVQRLSRGLERGPWEVDRSQVPQATPTPIGSTADHELTLRLADNGTGQVHFVSFKITSNGALIDVRTFDGMAHPLLPGLRDENTKDVQVTTMAQSTIAEKQVGDSFVTLAEAKERFPFPLKVPATPPIGANIKQIDYLVLVSGNELVDFVGIIYDNGLTITQRVVPIGVDPNSIVSPIEKITHDVNINGIRAKSNNFGTFHSESGDYTYPSQVFWYDSGVFYHLWADGIAQEELLRVAESLTPVEK